MPVDGIRQGVNELIFALVGDKWQKRPYLSFYELTSNSKWEYFA
jgi:hypothetical protein